MAKRLNTTRAERERLKLPFSERFKDEPPIDKAKIDAEPKPERTRFDDGNQAWFIDENGAWFLITIVRHPTPVRVVVAPVTGWDADRKVEWAYGPELEFSRQVIAGPHCAPSMIQRLRPLKARRP